MLHTDNILLRKVEPCDLPFLYQWENDSRSWADSDIHNPLSQKDLRDYIETSTGDIYKDGQLRLIIELKSESVNSTVGCIDLFDFDPHNRRAALGLYIAEHARGKGVGKTVVRLLEEYAFSYLNLRMLYVFVAENNAACIRLYKSLGWEQTASLKEWLNTGDVVVLQRLKQ